ARSAVFPGFPTARRDERSPDRQAAANFALAAGGSRAGGAARVGGLTGRDLDAVVIGWHPECEYIPGSAWIESGLVESCYHGLEGYRRFIAVTSEVWGTENYLKPVELIDLGD